MVLVVVALLISGTHIEESLMMQSKLVEMMLVDFRDAGELELWQPINDGVMGGLSSSALVRDEDTGAALFRGTLSLERNGGFASCRRVPTAYSLDHATTVTLRARGDGQRYRLRFRTDDRYDGIAYQATFDTTAGEWTEIQLPFAAFEPVFRGRRVLDAPRLDPSTIRQVGLMIADKQVGSFELQLDWLRGH